MIDSKPVSVRVSYGKEKEDQIMKCLNEKYASHGYNLVPSSFFEDCKEKTDCWQLTKSGKKYRSAIKARVSKNDILVAMRDPFYGVNDPETVIGRDVRWNTSSTSLFLRMGRQYGSLTGESSTGCATSSGKSFWRRWAI